MRIPGRRTLAALLMGAVGVVIVAEIGLRLFPEIRPSYEQTRIEELYKLDPDADPWWVEDKDFGYRVLPFRNDKIVTTDFSYTRQTDKFGFTNAAWPDHADIVFLGDSLLNGVGVGLERQFTTVVEHKIDGVSVLNLSLAGASPEHLLRFYQKFGAQMQPRVVVAVLYVASDVDNAKHFDVWNRTGRRWEYNEFRASHYLEALESLAGDGNRPAADSRASARENASGLRQTVRVVVNASVIGRELLYLTEPIRKGVIHNVSWPDGSEVFLYSRFQNRLLVGMGDDYAPVAEVFFDPLKQLRRVVEADGAAFVIALLPSKEEIFVSDDEKNQLRLVNEVRGQLDSLGMTVLDLYPTVREVAQTTAPFYPHDIHYNATGNEAIGNAIAAWLIQSGVLKQDE